MKFDIFAIFRQLSSIGHIHILCGRHRCHPQVSVTSPNGTLSPLNKLPAPLAAPPRSLCSTFCLCESDGSKNLT